MAYNALCGSLRLPGGVRVIYYWDESSDLIYLLLIYRKVDQDDLTPKQLKQLSRLVREELQ